MKKLEHPHKKKIEQWLDGYGYLEALTYRNKKWTYTQSPNWNPRVKFKLVAECYIDLALKFYNGYVEVQKLDTETQTYKDCSNPDFSNLEHQYREKTEETESNQGWPLVGDFCYYPRIDLEQKYEVISYQGSHYDDILLKRNMLFKTKEEAVDLSNLWIEYRM